MSVPHLKKRKLDLGTGVEAINRQGDVASVEPDTSKTISEEDPTTNYLNRTS